ncbi:aldo/keto reductase [Faecalibacterium duncaniae]|uniref:aldo/keto reductase n=1 Tax=Faecalibacterium duncaniae (strain DSM 17677 / JCM 31915 / A2-165) TaxID=411483 RepID=UPI002940C3B2|nr:aldo/keto reductase [Faecalibacterium duncaniae]MDV5092915.1 aldo/keto reductase [Faecalibacterium duncaniae]
MAKKKKPAGGNAIIYARYSSHNQRDVSIEQQIEACRKHAAELGLTITDTYEDRAISGRTDNRPAFQRMMRDAEDGKFQYVLAWKSNRMGRNMMQAMVNESRLMDCGVKVFYAEEDFDDSAAGRFALRSMMNVNQFYSDNLAEDVRRGLMDNASKCMANGRQPLGYKRGEGGKVVVDEPAAAIVREIYTRIASGEMFMDIARDLNRRGIKTQSGSEWNKSSFKVLCRNERYRGIYIYGDTRIEGGIPPIVDDVLWYKVQEVLKVKKSKNRHHCPSDEDYLLTGKLRCGKCGGYMIGMSGRSKTGDVHHYYACQNRRVGHTCDKKNIRRDVVEPAVAQAIKQYCLTDDAIEWITDQTIAYWEDEDRKLQIDSIENDLSAVQSSISNVMKAIEMGVITETTRDRLIELERQQTDLKSKLALAKEEIVHVDRKDLISSLLAFRHGNVHDRAYQEKLFNAFLIAVYVYDDDHLKLVFNSFGKDDTVNIALDLGENDDNSGLSDVSKSSPILSNGQPKRHPNTPDVFFCRIRVMECTPPLHTRGVLDMENIKKNFGFGCMRLPLKDGEIDLAETSRMVDYFLEQGFNYFDTAHGYLQGRSETALKTCLTSRHPRDSYILTNKLTGTFFKTEADIRPFFQSQLEACGVDYFDFYLMHAQSAMFYQHFKKCRAYETAFALKAEGKIKHVGISFHDHAEVLEQILTDYPEIEVVQIQFNYVDYDDPAVQSRECYEVCRRHGKPVLVMEPVKGGNLVNLPEEARKVLDELHGGSPASYAIRFAAGFPGMMMVLSGMSSMEQMKDNLSYMKDFQPLNETELEAVKKVQSIFRGMNLIPCTACRYCTDGCPRQIAIPDLFAVMNTKQIYHDWNADFYYNNVYTGAGRRASDCIQCGRCEKACPQHLPIRRLLTEIAAEFEKQ